MEAGEMEAALTVAEDGVALAEKAGVRWGYYGLDLRLVRGWALAALGRWDEALAASVEAVYAPTPPGRVLATLALAVLVDRGDPEAGALLQRLRGTGDEFADVQLLLCETKLRLREGLPREAVAVTERAMTVLGPGPGSEGLLALTLQATAHADLAATARLAGDAGAESVALGGARAAAEAAQALAGEPGLRGPFGELWLRRAALEADRAAGTVTGQDWKRLADLASRAGRIPDRMYALSREADARLAAGDRGAEAVAALSEALTIARRLGAAPDIVVLESLAHRSRLDAEVGLHPARRGRSVEHSAPQGVSLTEREREVLRLVAEGRSNRQIGKALFISDKTASVHVSNILVKLQAGSRTEAAALARAQGLLAEERTAVPPG